MKAILFALIVGFVVLVGASCGASPTATLSLSDPTPAPPRVTTVELPTLTEQPSPPASVTATSQPTLAPTATLLSTLGDTPTPLPPTPVEQWQPPQSPTETAAAQASPAQVGETCEDKAAFYADVTVPDNTVFEQGVAFEKTWQIKNAGTCTWENYHLVFAGGSNLDAPLSNPIPAVKPGELVNVSVKLKSPTLGGVYTSFWEFQIQAGKRFGVNAGGVDWIWAKIAVPVFAPGAELPGPMPAAATPNCKPTSSPEWVQQILKLVNQGRLDAGLPPLTLQPQLSAAAQAHSEDMACKNYTDHIGSDGSDWYARIKTQGYPYRYASENIFYGNPDFGIGPTDAYDFWFNSKVHHDNMFSTKVTEIGIGYAYSPDSTYRGYYTLNFGKR